jgi:Na+/melibiose symporter-like transporter
MLVFYFEVLLNMSRLPYTLLMYVVVFSTLGHPWLASIQISRRGKLETAMIGSLLPRVAQLLLLHAARR